MYTHTHTHTHTFYLQDEIFSYLLLRYSITRRASGYGADDLRYSITRYSITRRLDILLPDVRLDMGPTTWMPRTHTAAAHASFTKDDASKDKLIKVPQ